MRELGYTLAMRWGLAHTFTRQSNKRNTLDKLHRRKIKLTGKSRDLRHSVIGHMSIIPCTGETS